MIEQDCTSGQTSLLYQALRASRSEPPTMLAFMMEKRPGAHPPSVLMMPAENAPNSALSV